MEKGPKQSRFGSERPNEMSPEESALYDELKEEYNKVRAKEEERRLYIKSRTIELTEGEKAIYGLCREILLNSA